LIETALFKEFFSLLDFNLLFILLSLATIWLSTSAIEHTQLEYCSSSTHYLAMNITN